MPAVADLVAMIPAWAGRPVRWEPLLGGLSHHIYRVDVAGGSGRPSGAAEPTARTSVPTDEAQSYVLRILRPEVSEAGLGIRPDLEVTNTRRAAQSGVGARVVEILPEVPALVLEYLPGRTLGADDVRDPALTGAIAAACRRLHTGPRFANDFDIFDKRDELLALCRRHGLPLPDGYHDHDDAVDRIRDALRAGRRGTVPCHNDLLAENLVEHAGVVRIIDYQLSGNNDPTFELGDLAAESDFDPDQVARLAAAYFGSDLTPALIACVRLQLAASNATWALWFTVHSGLLSDRKGSGFDYAAEAADKWGQAVRDLTDAALGRLLDTAAGRPPAVPPPRVEVSEVP